MTELSKGRRIWNGIWQYKWIYFWILMAFIFDIVIYFWQGPAQAVDFASGYLIELSLSVDNLFVFLMLFIAFGITEHAQHKVLNYGIAGTIILRFLFIFLGISLINKFEWLLWVFGALLVISGAKMVLKKDDDEDPRDGIMYKIIAKFLPMSEDFVGEKFIVRNDGTNYDKSSPLSKRAKRLCTPLMVVMVLLIFTDIIFAIDSVPAVISMTRDMFIVLEHMHERFQYVSYGVAVILIFTGVKMILDIFDIHVHNLVSIGFIIVVLVSSIIISVIVTKHSQKKDRADRLERKKEIMDAFDNADKESDKNRQ